jgi:MFS family permease
VILAGLAFGVSACALFLLANGTAQLFAGRALQGVSVGLLGGTSSAALIDMRHASTVAPLVSSAAPTGGQALGAIGASALAQYAPAPTRLVWWIILAALIIASLAVATMRETGPRRPGVLSSFRPHIGVPRAARDTFVVAMPCLLAVWALAGFYLSLGPSLAGLLLHSANLLWGGVLIFLFTGLGAGASAALVRYEPTRVMLGGCILLVLGALVTFASIDIRIPAVLFAGTAVAGLGFGPAFMGAFRSATALAPPGDRASLITSIYVVSYLATGIPAVIGGIATTRFGLDDTALVYSLLVALLAAAAAILLISRPRHAANAVTNTNHPSLLLGPGTVPPCPPSP